MDVAYDHIQEEALSPAERKKAEDAAAASADNTSQPEANTLNTEFQQAFQAVSASPWGAKLGGWFSQARKQGETFYQDLSKEAAEASEQATKGFSSLREQVVQRARGMSDLQISRGDVDGPIPGQEEIPGVTLAEKKDEQAEAGAVKQGQSATEGDKAPESLPADIVKEAASLVSIFRTTAAQKLKDLQKAEDAADEALIRYGTNLKNFLRDAVTISAPEGGEKSSSEVLFSTEEVGTGKKVFHTTRLDAQLHAIHTSAASFAEEPSGVEWESWSAGFDIDGKTDAIASDLEKYAELRKAMEKLVPEKVGYREFWMRYYYLRKAVEAEEARRKEVLKGAATDPEEEVKWDDDDDDEQNEDGKSTTPNANAAGGSNKQAAASTTTLNAPNQTSSSATGADGLLSPTEANRRSEDGNKSVADSDASYDLVSGATSRAPGSPKEQPSKKKDEDSDDDWE